MAYVVRHSVRVVLLNDKDEVCLMYIDDPRIRSIGQSSGAPFWTLIGGEIEPGETPIDAAAREIFEETGIKKDDVQFGPVVWLEELDLVLRNEPTHISQQYMVARTRTTTLTLDHLVGDELGTVMRVAWFSLEQIGRVDDLIYPLLLRTYLPAILVEDYPDVPIDITSPPRDSVRP